MTACSVVPNFHVCPDAFHSLDWLASPSCHHYHINKPYILDGRDYDERATCMDTHWGVSRVRYADIEAGSVGSPVWGWHWHTTVHLHTAAVGAAALCLNCKTRILRKTTLIWPWLPHTALSRSLNTSKLSVLSSQTPYITVFGGTYSHPSSILLLCWWVEYVQDLPRQDLTLWLHWSEYATYRSDCFPKWSKILPDKS